jgi:hypothetical protein
MLHDGHDICAVLSELRRLAGYSWWPEQQRVDFPTKFVGEHPRGGNSLEADLPYFSGAGFD